MCVIITKPIKWLKEKINDYILNKGKCGFIRYKKYSNKMGDITKQETEILNEMIENEISHLIGVCDRVRNNISFKNKINLLNKLKVKINQNKVYE